MTRREANQLIALASASGLWAGGCGSSRTGRPQPPLPTSASADGILDRIRERHGLPGLAAAVVRGGHVVARGVSGVRRHGSADRIELDDRFHIASCTKSMTATLAAIAVHKGQARWTTSIAEGLPDLADRIRPEYRGATLEQLLAHAAKVPSYTRPSAQRTAEMKALAGTPAEQRLAFLAQVLAAEAPNEGTGDDAYSNAGYTAAAAIIERASGDAWEQLLQRELARPLGMATVGFGYPATPARPHQPRGHSDSDGRVVELPLDGSRDLAVALWPAGAVHCSVGDLALHAADHLNGLRGRPALLPRESYQRLHRTLDGRAAGFTLGWGRRRDPRWGVTHFGAGSGGWFFVRIAIVPDHDAAVVAAANSGQAAIATREVHAALLEEFAAPKA